MLIGHITQMSHSAIAEKQNIATKLKFQMNRFMGVAHNRSSSTVTIARKIKPEHKMKSSVQTRDHMAMLCDIHVWHALNIMVLIVWPMIHFCWRLSFRLARTIEANHFGFHIDMCAWCAFVWGYWILIMANKYLAAVCRAAVERNEWIYMYWHNRWLYIGAGRFGVFFLRWILSFAQESSWSIAHGFGC